MTSEEQRHLAGAIRNNLTAATTFEPLPGYSFAWRGGHLYRLPVGASAGAERFYPALLTAEEVYDLDDESLCTRAVGEGAPVPAPAQAGASVQTMIQQTISFVKGESNP